MSDARGSDRLRIACFGNVCNNFYQIACALRRHSDIDVHLYLDSMHDHQMLPESDDPSLAAGYPDWIHKRRFLDKADLLRPWRAELTRELAGYDVVMVSSEGLAFSSFTGRPVCFFVTGGDLTVMPFPFDKTPSPLSLKLRLRSLVISAWQRRGIRRATEIWSQPFSPFVLALKRLRVEPERVKPVYFPVMLDGEKFRLDEAARREPHEAIRQVREQSDFVLFHPSRLMMDDHPHLVAKGQWKRNELLFEGFAQFVARTGARRAALVMMDRNPPEEKRRAMAIVERLGIADQVHWLKAARPSGFTRDEMIRLYSAADVVADDFGIGWFGSVVLEGLAISRPVISYVDEAVMAQLYPWHPILSPRSAAEIASHLGLLYTQPQYREAVGRRGRQWIEEFHAASSASRIYIRQIQALAARLGLPEPRLFDEPAEAHSGAPRA